MPILVITQQPVSQSKAAGSSVTFQLQAKSEETYSWHWEAKADAQSSWATTDNGDTLSSGSCIHFSDSAAYGDADDPLPYVDPDTIELTLTASAAINGHTYRCVLEGTDTVVSNEVTLTVATSNIDRIPIDAEHFPDTVFRQYVSDYFDTNNDGYLNDTEISNAKTLSFSSSTSGLTSLASLAGLSLLPNINHINIQGAENLSDISELSALTKVSYLTISYCPKITTIDLSGISIALTNFYYAMRNGNPSNINISGLALCTKLQTISILNHGASGTDAPSQQASINNSNILDVSNLSELTHMSCTGFTITEINLEGCSALESLGLSRTNITSLDLTDYTALRMVSCANSLLGAIKVSSLSNLTQLTLNDTNLTELDVSGCAALTSLNISRTGISVLDLSDQQNLQYLLVTSASSLFSIPGLGQNSNLSRLHMGGTKLDASSINLNNHPSLKEFIAIRVPTLTSIDIGNSTYLLRAYRNGTHTSPPDIEQYYISNEQIELIVDKSLTISTAGGSASVLPVITAQPQSVTVPLKENATISVTASGENLQYQWQTWVNDLEIWSDIRDSGTTGRLPSFTVGSVIDSGHTSTYRCKVSNAAGAVYSNEATVTWSQSALPVIVTQPQSASVIEGEDVTFSIAASGNDLSYQWEVSIDDGETWADIRGAAASSFSFAASLGSNGNKVRCKVANSSGSVYSDVATLTVEEDTRLSAPVIDAQPSSVSVAEGSTASFFLLASGDNLAYQWQINQNGTWYSISGATSASYSITASLALNNARYRCQVSNAAGSIYSSEAMLTVTGGQSVSTPTVTSNPRSVTLEEGQLASFRVLATGGSLSYQWQVKRNNTWYAISGATSQVLSVRAASGTNGNQYRCQVSNAAGVAYSAVATLTVSESTPLTFYGYHSIIISGKNTYGEWQMYPTSRPHVAPPEVKTSYVDVPGADGGLDYTELLNGKPNYGYRKGSWEFLLIPQEKWPEVYRSLCNFLHGREHTIVLEDDPKWTYRGRLSVNEWRSAAHNSLITIDYILEPIATSTDDEGYDPDADDLDAAGRILRKPGNEDSAIILWNGTETVVPIDSLFEDGDNILY